MDIFALILAVIVLVLAWQNRSTGKRTGEDIDEIRNALYELRTSLKSLRAEWNLKLATVQVGLLKANKTIPENRIPYYITKDCISCGSCMPECPTNAITEGPIFEIDSAKCVACKKCAEICPVGACIPIAASPELAK